MPKPTELPGDGKTTVGDKIHIPMDHVNSWTVETLNPVHPSDINTSHVWNFVMKSRAGEFVRFYPESLSMVLYGTYANPARTPGDPAPETAAQNHALRAKRNLPSMFLLPTIMGSGFFSKVEVLINGVRVSTNDGLGTGLHSYVHNARIFNNSKEYPYLALRTDFASTGATDKTKAMLMGAKAFDYNEWNATTGTRIPAYLDGVFPFDSTNKTRASKDGKPLEAMYFPPETDFTFKFFLNQSKKQSIFHLDGCTMVNYFSDDTDGTNRDYVITFQDVQLSYESVTLKPAQHLSTVSKLSRTILSFPYDIPKFQYQQMHHNASYTENIFQILPKASVLYVSFLKTWQMTYMPTKHKPTSPMSRFPPACNAMNVEFGSERNLILKEMLDFGQKPVISQDISIYNYFKFLTERKLFGGSFDEMFPSETDGDSYIQVLVADLSSLSNSKTDLLKIKCYFTGATKSPKDTFISVLTVHSNGLATCNNNTLWEFKET